MIVSQPVAAFNQSKLPWQQAANAWAAQKVWAEIRGWWHEGEESF